MYTDSSNNTPFYTHATLYMVGWFWAPQKKSDVACQFATSLEYATPFLKKAKISNGDLYLMVSCHHCPLCIPVEHNCATHKMPTVIHWHPFFLSRKVAE